METVPEIQQRGREERFTSLAHVVAMPLRRYLERRIDRDTAQDVLADVFLVLWRRLDDVPADEPLPWCYGVARGCLANSARTARRQRNLVQRLVVLEPREPIAPTLDDTELHEALGQLSEPERELVRLWAWEELAPHEIAVVLGVTPNAVSIRLHRARKKLGELLRQGKADEPAGQEQMREGGRSERRHP